MKAVRGKFSGVGLGDGGGGSRLSDMTVSAGDDSQKVSGRVNYVCVCVLQR